MGQQQTLDVDANAGALVGRVFNDLPYLLFHSTGFLGNHAPVEFEDNLAWDHVGVGAAFNAPYVQIG